MAYQANNQEILALVGETLGCAIANSHAVTTGAYTQNVSGNDVTRTYNNPTNTSPRVTATFNNVSGTRGIATLNCP